VEASQGRRDEKTAAARKEGEVYIGCSVADLARPRPTPLALRRSSSSSVFDTKPAAEDIASTARHQRPTPSALRPAANRHYCVGTFERSFSMSNTEKCKLQSLVNEAVSNKGRYIVLYAKFRGYRAPLCVQQETLKGALKFRVRLRDAKSEDSLFVRYLHHDVLQSTC
jgi:hypothetical protein